LIFITIIDIKSGHDDWAYELMGELKGDGVVTPLLIGRIFEESDIILLLHSEDLEALDDYLIRDVRKTEAAQELVVVPIYEFTLLPSFDSVVEIGEESAETAEVPAEEPVMADELLMIMARIDVAPRMDKAVHDAVVAFTKDEGVIPLMAGHTFHSKEFDLVLFFLSRDLEAAWEFGKLLRSIEGVWDTDFSLIAHFEPLVPLEQFREFASRGQTIVPGM
jgi:hypothetical protein